MLGVGGETGGYGDAAPQLFSQGVFSILSL